MKLRNKKTGKTGELAMPIVAGSGRRLAVKPINGDEARYVYDSLEDLTDEWGDYKESNGYWIIKDGDCIEHHLVELGLDIDRHKSIGNYFETKEEAERAVEKLKAWKRLKDKGFSFESRGDYENLCGNGFEITISAMMPPEAYTDGEVGEDLDLLFEGGEE